MKESAVQDSHVHFVEKFWPDKNIWKIITELTLAKNLSFVLFVGDRLVIVMFTEDIWNIVHPLELIRAEIS